MHDIRRIREAPEAFDAMLARRGLAALSEEILSLDRRRRAAQTAFQEMQAGRNALSKRIGAARGKGEDTAELQAEAASMADVIAAEEAEEKRLGAELDALLATIPNWIDDAVPPGASEADNVVLRSWGEARRFDVTPLQHFELGERLGLMDFEAAGRIAGARFVVLKGALARLERALGQFMLDLQTGEHGYTEVNPPLLVNDAAAYGTDKLPKFGDDRFRTTDGRWLIPTAEVPVTNIYRDEIIPPGKLPIYLVASTPCFRREKVAAGKDVRGIKRVHQFQKVEMVKFVEPHTGRDELESLTQNAEVLLERLGLPYRRVAIATGDLSFVAAIKYDLEVWAGGCNEWLEVSSCSLFRDFQARRANIRYRPAEGARPEYVYTLNGSGLALPRIIIALLENNQQADGTVVIPEVLRPYMGGRAVIN